MAALGLGGFERADILSVTVDLLGVVIAAFITIFVAVEIPRRQQSRDEAKRRHQLGTAIGAFREILRFDDIRQDQNYTRGILVWLKGQILTIENLALRLNEPSATVLMSVSALKLGTEQFCALFDDAPETFEPENLREWVRTTNAHFKPTLDRVLRDLDFEVP